MNHSTEVYSVPKCPLCNDEHQYSLSIRRSKYLYASPSLKSTGLKHLKRLCTCPKTGEDFEVILSLKDDPENRIVSVVLENLTKG